MKYTQKLKLFLSHTIATSGLVTSLLLSNVFTLSSFIINSSSVGAVQTTSHNTLIAANSIGLNLDGIDFPVELDLRNAQIRGNIPRQLLTKKLIIPLIIPAINKLDGYKIKNTRYNKYTLKNIDLKSIDNGGATFGFTINAKKYECVKIFGRRRCARLFSVTLHGTMRTGLAIKNNQAVVTYRGHSIRGQKWYRDLPNLLDRAFKKHTVSVIKKNFSKFDSMNLITLLKSAGIDQKLPLGLTTDKLVKSGVSVNADISQTGLKFVIQLPDSILLSSNSKELTK